MKVNRFGVTKKIFVEMAVHWVNVRLHQAQVLRFNDAKEKALKMLEETEEYIRKIFPEEDPFALQEHRETLARLKKEITRELSVPA